MSGLRRLCSWRLLVVAALLWAAVLVALSLRPHSVPTPAPAPASRAPSAPRVDAPVEPLRVDRLLTTSATTAAGTAVPAAQPESNPDPRPIAEPGDGDAHSGEEGAGESGGAVPRVPQEAQRGVGERDYHAQPMELYFAAADKEMFRDECDIPCRVLRSVPPRRVDGHMFWFSPHPNPGPAVCNHSAFIGMESPAIYPEYLRQRDQHHIVGWTSLDTDVPLLYPSWIDFDFFRPPALPKTAEVAMVVSNCGAPNRRLDYVKQMMDYGVKVDSFGGCMHNKDIPAKVASAGTPWTVKVSLLEPYKFTVAFENSNFEDYVTEKLFQAFISASVPLHMGFSSIHRFAPGPKAVLSVHDFPSAREFAEHVLRVSNNETLWREHIAWKYEGTSLPFNDLMNLAAVHTQCRVCIRMADIDRRQGTPPVERHWAEDVAHFPAAPAPGSLFVRVRNRGYFYFRWLYVPRRTLQALHAAIAARFKGLEKLPPQPVRGHGWVHVTRDELYYVHKLPLDPLLRGGRERVASDADVARLTERDELEAVWNWSPYLEASDRQHAHP